MNDIDLTPLYNEYVQSLDKPDLQELASKYVIDVTTLKDLIKEGDWENDRHTALQERATLARIDATEKLSNNKIVINDLVSQTIAQMIISISTDLPRVQSVLASRIDNMANKDLIAYLKTLQSYQDSILKLASEASKAKTDEAITKDEIHTLIEKMVSSSASYEDVGRLHTDINELDDLSNNSDAQQLFKNLDGEEDGN
jgi:hypothetical protein